MRKNKNLNNLIFYVGGLHHIEIGDYVSFGYEEDEFLLTRTASLMDGWSIEGYKRTLNTIVMKYKEPFKANPIEGLNLMQRNLLR